MPSLASETSILNAALAHVGDGRRQLSVDGEHPLAVLFRDRYPNLRDAALRDYKWNFAKRRAQLSALVEAPLFDWAYRYQPPADCLRVWRVNGDLPGRTWELAGAFIETDMAAPINVAYGARVDNPAQWDPIFAELLALDLAIVMSPLASGRTTDQQRLRAAREDLAQSAQMRDAIEGHQEEAMPDEGSDWLMARYR